MRCLRGLLTCLARTSLGVLVVVACYVPSVHAKDECIGLVLGGADNFFQKLQRGAIEAAQAQGIKLYHRGPSGFDKLSAQLKIIKTLRKQGCNAFVVAPIGPEVDDIVSLYAKEDVPFVYVDRDTDGDHQAVSVIATDNYQAGLKAGREMVKALGQQGSVAILRLKQGIASTDKREQGFYDAVSKAGLKIDLDEYLGVTVGDAYLRAKALSERLADVQGVFTPNETTTHGVMKALDRSDLSASLVHIGFDLSPPIAEGIKAGKIAGVIVQDPFGMGYEGVITAHKALNHESVTKAVATPTHFVNASNLSEFVE